MPTGILSREGGISGKQAASWNGGFFRRVNSAGFSRGWIQQVHLHSFSKFQNNVNVPTLSNYILKKIDS